MSVMCRNTLASSNLVEVNMYIYLDCVEASNYYDFSKPYKDPIQTLELKCVASEKGRQLLEIDGKYAFTNQADLAKSLGLVTIDYLHLNLASDTESYYKRLISEFPDENALIGELQFHWEFITEANSEVSLRAYIYIPSQAMQRLIDTMDNGKNFDFIQLLVVDLKATQANLALRKNSYDGFSWLIDGKDRAATQCATLEVAEIFLGAKLLKVWDSQTIVKNLNDVIKRHARGVATEHIVNCDNVDELYWIWDNQCSLFVEDGKITLQNNRDDIECEVRNVDFAIKHACDISAAYGKFMEMTRK